MEERWRRKSACPLARTEREVQYQAEDVPPVKTMPSPTIVGLLFAHVQSANVRLLDIMSAQRRALRPVHPLEVPIVAESRHGCWRCCEPS